MVERAEHWPCTRQQTAKAPESPSVQTLVGRLPLEACLMYQCQGCRTVLGDSLHLCESREEKLRLAVCFSEFAKLPHLLGQLTFLLEVQKLRITPNTSSSCA